jgi:glycosyltransferase involved in cell wall biosynthesis
MPRQNLAAKLIVNHGAGVVVEPNDLAGFCRSAAKMLADPEGCARSGAAARHYAEANFDIDQITDRFQATFQ